MDLKETERAIIVIFVRFLTYPLTKIMTVKQLDGTSAWYRVGAWKVKLLNMMSKIKLKKIKVDYGLIIDIKGYHIHFLSSSNSSIEKSYDGYYPYTQADRGTFPGVGL